MRTRRSQRKPRQDKFGGDEKENVRPYIFRTNVNAYSAPPTAQETKEAIYQIQRIVKEETEESAREENQQVHDSDQTPRAELTASQGNVIYMETDEKPAAVSSENKEVVDLSHGYVELASLYNHQDGEEVPTADCIYGNNSGNYSFHLVPASGENEEAGVLTYGWNQAGAVTSSNTDGTSTTYSANFGQTSHTSAWHTSVPRKTIYATAVPNTGREPAAHQTTLVLTSTQPSSMATAVGTVEAAGDAFTNSPASAKSPERTLVPLSDVLKDRHYAPTPASRQTHNEKERRRRSRMKRSCEMLRTLVPGVGEKTDKATVLEQAVKYLVHLQQCVHVTCDHYVNNGEATHKVHYITAPFRCEASVVQVQQAQEADHQYYEIGETQVDSSAERPSVACGDEGETNVQSGSNVEH